MALVRAAESPALLVFRLIGSIGFVRAVQILRRFVTSAGKPTSSLATIPFYSALPIRVGPYAARFAFSPRQTSDTPPAADRGPDYLAEDLRGRLNAQPLAYDMRLQFFEDEATTPIEDSSIDWNSPYVDVARLTIDAQDTASAEGKAIAEKVEAMSFDPWHALADHTPLGGMMRARKVAYFASTQARGASPEP